jgi:murein L,D-transpeptidase YafK
MLRILPLLLAYTAALHDGDSTKAKPLAPAKGKKPGPTASAVIATAAKQTISRFAGPTATAAATNAVSELAPRTTYLTRVLKRAVSGPPLPARFASKASAVAIHADSIVVEKGHRTLTLYDRGAPVRIYFVALGNHPTGAKAAQGDGRTPEGMYYIAGHNPESKYHLSLLVSYPNDQDVARARARGVPTGGDIMIHGLPDRFASYGALHRQWDWTEGCIAVTNDEIEEIWSAVPDGAIIQIKP